MDSSGVVALRTAMRRSHAVIIPCPLKSFAMSPEARFISSQHGAWIIHNTTPSPAQPHTNALLTSPPATPTCPPPTYPAAPLGSPTARRR